MTGFQCYCEVYNECPHKRKSNNNNKRLQKHQSLNRSFSDDAVSSSSSGFSSCGSSVRSRGSLDGSSFPSLANVDRREEQRADRSRRFLGTPLGYGADRAPLPYQVNVPWAGL